VNRREAKRFVCAETAWWLEAILPSSVALNDPEDAERIAAAAQELHVEMHRRAGLGQRPVDERQLRITL
jgi:hypothetical protein